jgi:hypothetical protein
MVMNHEQKMENIKLNINKMLQERAEINRVEGNELNGTIWSDLLSLFEYAMHLTPKDLENARFHAAYLTGSNIMQYYQQFPPLDGEQYADNLGYKFLVDGLPEMFWLSEPLCPGVKGPIGVNYRGRIINQDICRYQSCVTNLYNCGVFNSLAHGHGLRSILEIGGGYGGLAYQMSEILERLNQKTTYIIIDLPEILLFAGAFLMVNKPNGNIYIYDTATFTDEFIRKGIYEYDFVLLPNFALKRLWALPEVNLIINMQSFQEMTPSQINDYLCFADAHLSGFLYSDNIEKHPFNKQITGETVTSLLAERFELFPSGKFYDGVIGSNAPWFYRTYVGVSGSIGISKDMCIKFISWPIKHSVIKKGNKVIHKQKGVLFYWLIWIGLKVVKLIFRI